MRASGELDPAAGLRALQAHRGRERMRQRLGRYDDALDDFAAARELARAAGDATAEVEILLDEATALDWMNDYARSEERVIAAETLARERGLASPTIEASLLLGLGRSRHRYSREDEAAPLIELAAELAFHLGDEAYETRVVALLMLGFINQGTGRLEAAARVLDRPWRSPRPTRIASTSSAPSTTGRSCARASATRRAWSPASPAPSRWRASSGSRCWRSSPSTTWASSSS